MRCIAFILTATVIISSIAEDVDLRVTPICIVQYEDGEMPCASFKERSLEKLLEESWSEEKINRTTFGNQYTNITLFYKRKSEMSTFSLNGLEFNVFCLKESNGITPDKSNGTTPGIIRKTSSEINRKTDPKYSVFVMIRYDEFPLPFQSWEMRPVRGDVTAEGPLSLTIAFAPNPRNTSSYGIRRILNPGIPEQACNSNDTAEDCKSLHSSKLFMRKSWGNSLSLSISSSEALHTLTVEVLSSECNITCRGDINPCSGVEIRNIKWENPSDGLKIFNSANKTSPMYYCARISPVLHECCIIYTETIFLDPDHPEENSVTFSQKIYLPEVFMVLSILLLLLVSAMFSVRKIFGRSWYKCWPYYSIGSQDNVGDGLLPVDRDTPPKCRPPAIQTQPVIHNLEVLLIYHKESAEMEKLMSKFRYILSFYVSKIWDPLDEDEIESVSEGPTAWVKAVLSRGEHVKVILVESGHSIDWYQATAGGGGSRASAPGRPPPHHLDNLFLYVLTVLHNNPYLCHNYQRLFIVRFASSKLDTKSTDIVPCTRYVIPQNFANLIRDIGGSYSEQSRGSFAPPLKEIEELEILDLKFQSTNNERIHYTVG